MGAASPGAASRRSRRTACGSYTGIGCGCRGKSFTAGRAERARAGRARRCEVDCEPSRAPSMPAGLNGALAVGGRHGCRRHAGRNNHDGGTRAAWAAAGDAVPLRRDRVAQPATRCSRQRLRVSYGGRAARQKRLGCAQAARAAWDRLIAGAVRLSPAARSP
jgi:hypothetical protein